MTAVYSCFTICSLSLCANNGYTLNTQPSQLASSQKLENASAVFELGELAVQLSVLAYVLSICHKILSNNTLTI